MQDNSNNYANHINDVMMQQFKSAEENKKIKKQYAHEWKLALFNTFGGALAGLITSIIFWLITK